MKDLDYGKDYGYAHDDLQGAKQQTHLPKELEGRKYYRPTDSSPPGDDEEDLRTTW